MNKFQIRTYVYNTVIVLLLLAGITYVVLQFTHFGRVEYTDNARVCQYISPQNTRVQGFVREIRFEAYQHVNAGDTLVILEDSEFKLRLAQAQSDLARAEQQSKATGSSIRTTASSMDVTAASIEEARVNMAILLPVCFIAGIAKIQGTFECMSNIQLWITPPRDFGVFFPVLHIVLLTAITGSAWLAAVVAFHFTWQMMHVLTIGTMCYVVLSQLVLCRPWCPMPQRMPLRGIDISSGLLISLLMLMACCFMVYGDYLMWFSSPLLRWVFALSLILLAFVLYRLKTVEKPYISLDIFKYRNMIPILLVTVVAEILLGAEHTLEEIYWTEVRALEEHTKTGLGLWSLPGVYVGVGITLFWLGHKRWKVWKLFAIGFGCILAYAVQMYFYLDVNAPLSQYRLALVCRGCAYAILAASLMWSLHESVHDLEHFFMALFVFNVIHMYLAGAAGYGIYTTLFQHFMADNVSRYGAELTLTHIGALSSSGIDSGFMHSMMAVTLKQIFGQIIWVAALMTSAFMLLDIPRVRTGIGKVPYWPVYGIELLARVSSRTRKQRD